MTQATEQRDAFLAQVAGLVIRCLEIAYPAEQVERSSNQPDVLLCSGQGQAILKPDSGLCGSALIVCVASQDEERFGRPTLVSDVATQTERFFYHCSPALYIVLAIEEASQYSQAARYPLSIV